MKLSKLCNLLNGIEDKFPVDMWIVDGIHIWPILRMRLYFQLGDFGFTPTDEERLTIRIFSFVLTVCKEIKGLICYLLARLVDCCHDDGPNRHVDAVFLNHTTCRVFAIDGKWFDVFCEPIITGLRELKKTSLLLEFAPDHKYRIPRFHASHFIQHRLFCLKIMSVLNHAAKDDRISLDSFGNFVNYLREHAPEIRLPSVAALKREVRSIRLTACYFAGILRKTGARHGFVVTYYGNEGMAFTLACREVGIPSIDIQHGVQGRLHPAYGRWYKMPENGYDLLPDFFWCWSRSEVDAIHEWSDKVISRHKAFVGGNLALSMFKEDDNYLVRYFDPQILAIKGKCPGATHVLITLQTDLGFPKLIRQAVAAASASCFWWVRLHPGMMGELETIGTILKDLNNMSVNLIEASNLPLYALLRHMDVHLTERSTTVIEAASFGVPSVICGENGTELFADYIADGAAVSAFTCQDLLEAIHAQAARKKQMHSRMQSVLTTLDLERFMVQSSHQQKGGHG